MLFLGARLDDRIYPNAIRWRKSCNYQRFWLPSSTSNFFQFIKVTAEHYQSDIKSDYLEQQIQVLRYSKLLS